MFWSFRDRRRFLYGGLSIGLAMTVPVKAQTVPRLDVDLAVLASDNPFLVTGGERGAVQGELTVRPGIAVTMQDGTTFDLAMVATGRAFSRRYDGIVTGRVDAVARHRRNEYLSFGTDLAVARDAAIDLLTSSVESALDTTSIRTTRSGRVFVEWRPDARTTLRPEIGFERFGYERSALLADTRSVSAGIAWRRLLNARRTAGVRAGWTSSDAGRLTSFSTASAYATLEQQLSATWHLNTELGAERNGARSETMPGGRVRQPALILLAGRMNLCRRTAGPELCMAGSISSQVSGLGGLQRRAVVGMTGEQRLGERTMARASADYQRTTTQNAVVPPFDAIRVLGAVERTLGRDLQLAVTGQYLRRRLIDGRHVGAGFAGLRLTYRGRAR